MLRKIMTRLLPSTNFVLIILQPPKNQQTKTLITGGDLRLSTFLFQACSGNCEKRIFASSCLSIYQSAWYNSAPLPHWTDFYEILYLSIFRKSVEKIQILLNSDKNNGYFTRGPIYNFIISYLFLRRMRNVSGKCGR